MVKTGSRGGNDTRRSFPPDTLVGQSGYLRIAALIDFPVLDLSGLVNAELAHSDHAATMSLSSVSHLLRTQPDVSFLWWHFVSERKLGAHALRDEARNQILRPPDRPYPREAAQSAAVVVGSASQFTR